MAIKSSKISKITGTIAALRTILEDYPDLQTITITPTSTIALLLEICRILGFDYKAIIKWVSTLLAGTYNVSANVAELLNDNTYNYEDAEKKVKGDAATNGLLDAIEWAIRVVLLTNFQNLFTCSVNPFLPDELMIKTVGSKTKDYSKITNNYTTGGMSLNVESIDAFGLLNKCPVGEKEGAFYFDTRTSICGRDSGYNASDVWKSCDFNAYLWYLINKGSFGSDAQMQKCIWDNRCTFYNYRKFQKDAQLYANFFKIDTSQYGGINSTLDEAYRTINGDNGSLKKKQILVGEFTEGRAGTINSDSLKFWLPAERYYRTRRIGKNFKEREDVTTLPEFDDESYNYNDAVYVKSENCYYVKKKKSWVKLTGGLYLNKTIFEFNYDFVMSLKLFDSKVIVAEILNSFFSLVGNLSLSAGYTIQQKEVAGKIGTIVKNIIEQDDTEIDDSSYNFSNEGYEDSLKKATLYHSGQIIKANGELADVDSESLLNDVLDIDNAATEDERVTKISNAFEDACVTLAENGYTEISDGISFGGITQADAMWKALLQIIQECVVQIVMQTLSPKVMVLFAINSYIMDRDPSSSAPWEGWDDFLSEGSGFIEKFKTLIKQITVQIKDAIVQQLYEWVMKQLKPLIKLFLNKLVLESLKYYEELIEQLLETCFPSVPASTSGQSVIDNVNYADIKADVEATPSE